MKHRHPFSTDYIMSEYMYIDNPMYIAIVWIDGMDVRANIKTGMPATAKNLLGDKTAKCGE